MSDVEHSSRRIQRSWRPTHVLAGFGVVAIVMGLLALLALLRSGFSARPEPSQLEASVARGLRKSAIPSRYEQLKNPVAATPAALDAAMEHWADHCATCHANDGSGGTSVGRNLYPRPPDMRARETQELSDGELYYVINQGIRFTGMPAWGTPGDQDMETWALVGFIRTLPALTPDQLERMKTLNPISAATLAARQQEDDFLSGEPDHPHEPDVSAH
jgi:mono/diheme cytochrome c family protein